MKRWYITPTVLQFRRCLAVAFAATAVAASGVAADVEHGRGRLGVAETFAGPGFCQNDGIVDEESRTVGALAADAGGRIFFETGPAANAHVARVDPSGRARAIVTGVPRERGGASRIVADGEGGVILASGTRIYRIDAANSATTLAGTMEVSRSSLSGDGGPASQAHFTRAVSLASDDAGNLFVADQINERSGAIVIRFINRMSSPVTIYPGTPQQLVVPPGNIETIAGAINGAHGDGQARQISIESRSPALAAKEGRLYVAVTSRGGLSGPQTRVALVNLGGAPIAAHGVAVAPGEFRTVVNGEARGRPDKGRESLLSSVPGMAADADGNIFLADRDHNRVLRIDSSGVVSTFAGIGGTNMLGASGFAGNGRAASQSLLNGPYDVKVGGDRRVYISDSGNGQVRAVDRMGTILAVPGAGIATAWTCGSKVRNAGPMEAAIRGAPSDVVVSTNGLVYAAVPDAGQVKVVEASGAVATVVGVGPGVQPCDSVSGCPSRGDGGPARFSELVRPTALAVAPDALYVLDAGDARVRVVNLSSKRIVRNGVSVGAGSIATVAGTGRATVRGDGETAVAAELGVPRRLALEEGALAVAGGDLFVADPANQRVRRVDSSGKITTYAGDGMTGSRSTCCRHPVSLAVDDRGNLLVGDSGRDDHSVPHPRVWLINSEAQPVTALGQIVEVGAAGAVAGNGSLGFGGDGAMAKDAEILVPTALALNRSGALHIAGVGDLEVDEASQSVGGIGDVRRVDVTGRISPVAGNGQAGFNGDGLKGQLTSLNLPSGLAFDPCGNLLIAEAGSDRLRRIDYVGPCNVPSPKKAESAGRGRVLMITLIVSMAVAGAGVHAWRVRRRQTRPIGARSALGSEGQ